MDLKEFLNQYMNNLSKELEQHKFTLNDVNFNCSLCPMEKQCSAESETGDKDPCGKFIKRNLSDGDKYMGTWGR